MQALGAITAIRAQDPQHARAHFAAGQLHVELRRPMWQPPAWSLTWRSGRAAGLGLVGRPYSAHLNDLVQ